MKSQNCFLQLGVLLCAVVWSGAVGAQTEWVKVTPEYAPQELYAAWSFGGSQFWPRIVTLSPTSGTNAYVAFSADSLQVIDISNPINPKQAGTWYDTAGWPFRLPVSTKFSYVPDAIESWLVTDNSDPANPKKVGGYKAIASVSGVEVSGNYAYVSEGEGRLAVINVSSPANPQRAGEYRGTNDIAKVVVAGTYVYALARGERVELANGEMGNVGSGLQVIDVSAPASPQKIG